VTNLFRATLPYGVPHSFTGARIDRGTLAVRVDRHGRQRVAVVTIDSRRETLGKVLEVLDTPAGVAVTVDLGAHGARDLVADLNRGVSYYLEPLTNGRTLIGVTPSAVESWPAAELKPVRAPLPAPPSGGPRRVPVPIGPRPDVNLTPDLGLWRFDRRR
jgi:hypothetical protein